MGDGAMVVDAVMSSVRSGWQCSAVAAAASVAMGGWAGQEGRGRLVDKNATFPRSLETATASFGRRRRTIVVFAAFASMEPICGAT